MGAIGSPYRRDSSGQRVNQDTQMWRLYTQLGPLGGLATSDYTEMNNFRTYAVGSPSCSICKIDVITCGQGIFPLI